MGRAKSIDGHIFGTELSYSKFDPEQIKEITL